MRYACMLCIEEVSEIRGQRQKTDNPMTKKHDMFPPTLYPYPTTQQKRDHDAAPVLLLRSGGNRTT